MQGDGSGGRFPLPETRSGSCACVGWNEGLCGCVEVEGSGMEMGCGDLLVCCGCGLELLRLGM